MARPCGLTDELQAEIVTLVERGNFPETAAIASGVQARTYYEWMARGRRGEEPFVQFAQSIGRARAKAETRSVEIVEAGASLDPKHAAWLLERRNSERWASKIRVTVEKELTDAVDRLSREFAHEPAILERALAALSAVGDLSVEALAGEVGGGPTGEPPVDPRR